MMNDLHFVLEQKINYKHTQKITTNLTALSSNTISNHILRLSDR